MHKDIQCILCPYKKEHECSIHEKCYSLSNIYYGTLCKHFPFRQIDNLKMDYDWKMEEKHNKKMKRKYGDYTLENDEIKFVWGIIGTGELSGKQPNLYTMNDIEIIYHKKEKRYYLDIETAYLFQTSDEECRFLRNCLSYFSNFMDENGLSKMKPYNLFMSRPDINMAAESLEELYTNFRLFVDGFCLQNRAT